MRPTEPFSDGRDAGGRFAKGNPGGPGNPHARNVARFRAVLLDTVTDADFGAIIRVLVDAAKAGEPWAVKELLDRTIGKPGLMDDPQAGPDEDRDFVVPPPRVMAVVGECFKGV